ncbi:putative RNA helicase armi, partial [Pseudolycoriella hygida]
MAEEGVPNTSEKTSEKNKDQIPDVNSYRFQLLGRIKFWHIVGAQEECLHHVVDKKRLENLRKELVGLKNTEIFEMWLITNLWSKFNTQSNEIEDIQNELDKVLESAKAIHQEYEEENGSQERNEDLRVSEQQCVLSRGKITSLSVAAGRINNEIVFPITVAGSLNLSVGQTVSYLWYQKHDESIIRICKIVEIVEENWNEPVTEEAIEELRHQRPEVFEVFDVKKVGFIIQKRKDRITIDGETSFSLDDIEYTFKPRVYDQVAYVCRVQRDPKLVNEAGITLKIVKMVPNITKTIKGKITALEEKVHGVICNQYFFFWDALDPDYRTVNVGDSVSAECIQCERTDETFEWRCLSVVLMESAISANNDITYVSSQKIQSQNMNGIEITDNIVVEFFALNETKQFKMLVKNKGADAQNVLESVFIGNKYDSQLKLISPARSESFSLQPGEERQYVFEAKSRFFGDAMEKLYIKFNGPAGRFKIMRFITISVNDIDQLHSTMGTGANLHRNVSYTRQVMRKDFSHMIPGVPLKKNANFVYKRLQTWDVPKSLSDLVTDPKCTSNDISETLDLAIPPLKSALNIKIYCLVFHNLLYLEECEMHHSMRKYDKKAFFKREKEYLSLPVQNIAETRPSLVIGDYVIASKLFVSQHQRGKEEANQGFIHDVKGDRILLKFSDAFHCKYNSEDYDIKFFFSRMPLRKQHHALELVYRKLPFVLFPSKIMMNEKQMDVELDSDSGEMRSGSSVIPWFNPLLNIIQKEAVVNILQGVARPMPYVIFGPPGTGKTITLIETILQILKNVPHSRILVATPSNSSANLITQRIVESGVLMQGEFLRLVSENSIRKENIPEDIIRHCGTIDLARDGTIKDIDIVTESGLKMCCNTKFLKMRRLLIGTCITLGTLMMCEISEDHFTHVIVDESGQCMETEIMVPISFVEKQLGQIILAGDPMQLGPIILSRYAAARGLEQSFLVRLLNRPIYKADSERFKNRYDPRLVTRLVYNYRSLPSILSIYSELFYDKDLKAMVNDVDSEEAQILRKLKSILPNEELRNVSHGVVFIGVEGKSQRCMDSPSWLNKAEANNVLQFLMKLVRNGFNADDIGVITPYTQQVKTIRMLLEKTDLIMPKVGTVEEFQGQERKIILLSTVRSSARDELKSDKRHSLGFIKSPKRMNVAISRARALLIIFGSPALLVRDDNWKFLIEKCIKSYSTFNCNSSFMDSTIYPKLESDSDSD